MPRSKIKYNLGLNTAKDVSELDNGELRVATGVYYKPGDPDMAHTIGGNTLLSDAATPACRGGAVLQFDAEGTSRLALLSGGNLYTGVLSADGGTIPDGVSATKTGMSESSAHLGAAHYNDKWYLCDGSENFVIGSDGSERSMGMSAPAEAPTVTVQNSANAVRPSASDNNSGFTNPELAYNTNTGDYAHAVMDSPGSSTIDYQWTGTSDTGTDRFLNVRWGLAGGQQLPSFPSDGAFDDVGGSIDAGFSVRITMEYSEDGGDSFTEFLSERRLFRPLPVVNAQVPITDTFDLEDNLVLRVTMNYGGGTSQASLRILDITAGAGSSTAAFSTDTGVYYAVTEWDDVAQTESPASDSSALITFSSGSGDNSALVALPSAPRNSRATHYRVYRTNDGGTSPSSLGRVGQPSVASSSYLDTFDVAHTELAFPVYPLLRGVAQQDASGLTPAYYDFNSPPPALAVLRVFEGSLVGLSDNSPRSMYYAAAGYPEAWPEINVISSFPFEENDELVDCVALGQILLVAAKGLIMRLNSLPRLVNSVRDVSRVEPIRGAPGCVGRKALTAYTVSGTPMAAWISPLGIYVTNGDVVRRISDDLDWSSFANADKSKWCLAWDAQRQCLAFSCSKTGGANDEMYLLHMAPEHAKQGGQPKITGPHYRTAAQLNSVQVGGRRRLYSFDSKAGKVFIEDDASADASNAYDSSGTNPAILETGRIYASDDNFSVLDAFPYHSGFSGGTADLKFTVGSDRDGFTEGLTKTVDLGGSKASHVDVSRQGEWLQVRMDYTGQARGAIGTTGVNIRKMGRAGTVKLN